MIAALFNLLFGKDEPESNTAITENKKEETAVICPVCGEVDYVVHEVDAVKQQSCEECNAFFIVRFKGNGIYEIEVLP